jgi:hypothetical protein
VHSSSQTRILFRSLLICTVAVCFATSAFGKGSFEIKPAGSSWIRKITADLSQANKNGTSSSVLLEDRQVRVGSGTVERYTHRVQRIDTAAGLDDLSQLSFEFEPSYERLAIHFIRILRGKETINNLNPSEIKVIQKEDDLDQQLFNGTLNALIFLNDLRVGDVIDYAYTVTGENPVLGGRYVERFDLANYVPVQQLTLRVLLPSNRKISITPSNLDSKPQVAALASETEYFWERQNVAALDYEDSTPGWFDPYPSITMSEFENWAGVVQWAAPLYKLPATNSPKMAAKIEGWKTEFATPAERAIAALRFVQDEIRYLGIEMGRYSHQPTSPDKVFARRFGDCKDKSFLLVAMLHAMNIEAAPALVNSRAGRGLDHQQPSPYAFDHVIVQAKIEGKTYWFDATMSYQRGSLKQYYDPPYERALVISDGIASLDSIPLPASGSGSIETSEVYQSTNKSGPVSLRVSTTYRGAEADEMRYRLSTGSLADLSKQYLNFYAEYSPSIKADGLPVIDDDQNNNSIVITEKYLIDSFWRDGRHRFLAERLYSDLSKPSVQQRSSPLRVAFPLSLTHRTVIDLAEPYSVRPDRISISDDSLKFDYSCANVGNVIKLEYSLRTLADSVPVEKIGRHLESIDRIQEVVGFELTSTPGTVFVGSSSAPSRYSVLGTVAFLSGLALFAVLFFRRHRQNQGRVNFPSLLITKRGGSPDTAIKVANDEQIEELLAKFECRCGQRPYNRESPPARERFRYDGDLLFGMRLRCQSCSQDSDLYVNFSENKSEPIELGLSSIESTRQ